MTTASNKREHWRSRLGVVFATCGSAIGLGTLWKLPFMIGENGGGAFVFLFLIFTLALGTPLFMAELILGKINRGSLGKIFFCDKKYGFLSWPLGTIGLLATFLIAGWYAVISGWGLHYLYFSLIQAFDHKSPKALETLFTKATENPLQNLFWQVMFIALTCYILAKGVKEGIEKYSKFFFSLLFIFVVGIFLYGMSLPGFADAFSYIMQPKFHELTIESVFAALGLSLFSLSLGQGIMVTYGSYLPDKQGVTKTAFIVSFSVVIISVLISLMIFPYVFTFGLSAEAKEGLLFITMPFVTEQLVPMGFLSAIFFLLLIFAALTSYMGQLEVLIASFMETAKFSRTKAAILAGIMCFLFGLPAAFFPGYQGEGVTLLWLKSHFWTITNGVVDSCLIFFSIGVCLLLTHKESSKLLADALNMKNTSFSYILWAFFIKLIVPISLLLVAVYNFWTLL